MQGNYNVDNMKYCRHENIVIVTEKTADKILDLFVVSVAKRKVCPHCNREFDQTEVPSGIFCCYACEYGY